MLGDYWLPDRAVPTDIGELVRCAKDRADGAASADLARRFSALAGCLPEVPDGASRLVIEVPPVPGTDSSAPNAALPAQLAQALASSGAGLWQEGAVTRRFITRKLRDLPPGQRQTEAAAGGYEVRRPVAGHPVVLVDDVILTGATLNEVATRLRAAGAVSVIAAAAARSRRA